MYSFRLCEILRHDFEAVERVVGEALFRRLAVEYLDAHPPSHPSVRHLGRRLAGFLETHALADRFPWLAELAQLEWARGEMIDGPDSEPVTPEALAAVAPERWPELRFGLVRAHQILRLDYPVHRVWMATREARPLPDTLEAEPTHLITWRQGITVNHRRISAEEAQLLNGFGEERTLAEIGLRLQQAAPDRDNGQFIATALRRWVPTGLLRTINQVSLNS